MKKALIFGLVLVLLLSACSSTGASTPAQTSPAGTATVSVPTYKKTLTVMTHDSFAVSQQVIAQFENENHVTVLFVKSGDAGAALNKAILSKNNPIADVFYGVDNTFLSRAINAGIYEPYNSPSLSQIPDQYKLDPQNRALPVDFGDVCLNYDKQYFSNKGLNPPQSLEDLVKPEYKSLLVVENPATSSPGLAFLLTTISHFGENGYLDYWKSLAANDVKVENGWENAYYMDFSGSSGHGPRPIVVSYDSSPAFEVIYANPPISEPPTAAIVADGTCFRQIEFVGILKGTKNLELAQKWVDFMLSPTFQEDMPLQMFVFPVNQNTKLDPVFEKYLALPKNTVTISPEEIAAKRDQWIQAWTSAVLP